MKKWVCSVCGYVYEGEQPPVECPVCHVDGSKFIEQKAEKSWAAEHVVGVGKAFGSDVPADVQKEIVDGLRANFEGECSEVGMYLAMARVAHREGYPEIGLYWEKAAHEEAEHAAKFAELLGSDLESNMTDSTKKNLAWRVDCEFGATNGKFELAACAKKNGLDAITTPSMRWPATRPVTARRSRACWSATSSKPKALKNQEIFKGKLRDRLPLFCSAGEWGVDKKVDVRSCFRQ